jgi:hypothetical protein
VRKKNTRDIGDELEKLALDRLGPAFRTTAGSGSVWKDGDLRHQAVVVECKVKNSTEGFTAPLSELKKLKELAVQQGKDWLYIEENKNGNIMILLDFEAFIEMTEEWRQKYE